MALAAALAVACLTGCSLFTSGETEKKESNDPIVISEDITHEDPTDIEFTTRYAFHATSDNQNLIDIYREQFGIGLVDEANILYGDKDDVAVRLYSYFAFETEEDAAKYCDELKQYDYPAEIKGKTVYYVVEKDELKDQIDGWIAMSVMEESTASAYATFLKELDSLIEY